MASGPKVNWRGTSPPELIKQVDVSEPPDLRGFMSIATMTTGKSLQLAGPSVPGRDLSAYITSVNSIAVLTVEQERELAKKVMWA
jgi:hypothetical protein